MKKYASLLIAASVTVALGGCASTASDTNTQTKSTSAQVEQSTVMPVVALPENSLSATGEITLKQIMADPQW
ncbi:MAG: hypothetical protein VX078_10175, partial [Pseudomonadota bacterium]|nr:hypothetical protein [Pseudomonadota bacterium]